MEEKDKDLETTGPTSGAAGEAADQSRRDAGNLSDPEKASRPQSEFENDDASVYTSDSADHGNPDLEHADVEETILGHELDRQLSRVGFIHLH